MAELRYQGGSRTYNPPAAIRQLGKKDAMPDGRPEQGTSIGLETVASCGPSLRRALQTLQPREHSSLHPLEVDRR